MSSNSFVPYPLDKYIPRTCLYIRVSIVMWVPAYFSIIHGYLPCTRRYLKKNKIKYLTPYFNHKFK